MKVHKRIINGQEVKAYNDSNAEWVVSLGDRVDRYDMRKWGMKEAMVFMVELFGEKK